VQLVRYGEEKKFAEGAKQKQDEKEITIMDRRKFLRLGAPLAVTPFVVNGFQMRPYSSRKLAGMLNGCDGISERVMVLIQLKGGNDGLNTVIPLDQFAQYVSLRPTTHVNETGSGKYIALDNTLPIENQVGLNPAMTAFKDLYDQGKLAVVQGVGYENINQSHFKGTDILLTGGDGTPNNFSIKSGWMGRALQGLFPDVEGIPTPDMPDPLGIQVGSAAPSLGFHTETEHQNMINLSGQDPAGFFSLISTIGGQPLLNIPDSEYGDEISFMMNVEASVSAYAQRITQVFNAGTNSATYPSTRLSEQLKTVARLISGGSKTKIYLCELGGFDTHDQQILTGDPSQGDHPDLLFDLSNSVKAFMDDLAGLGLDDRVTAVTFSEFGRCAKENGGSGTDHGTLAPMFVIGKNIKAGVVGTNVNLSNLTSDNQLQGTQHDYRQVFATVLQDWIGASADVMQDTMFDGYQKLNLIDTAAIVDPGCYLPLQPSGIADLLKEKSAMRIFPNPAAYHAEVRYTGKHHADAALHVFSSDGRRVMSNYMALSAGESGQYLNVSSLTPGVYQVILDAPEVGVLEKGRLVVVRG
jgi:uncharacterized protein (DUF1501 family)